MFSENYCMKYYSDTVTPSPQFEGTFTVFTQQVTDN